MFWGLIMEPQRRYTHKVKKSFHISMAALDAPTGPSADEPAQVMCGHEGRTYLLCTLKAPDAMQCFLDLNYEEGAEISFATNGKSNVHLTGYLLEENSEELVEEEKEKKSTKKKRNADKAKSPPVKKFKSDSDDLDFKSILLGTSMDEEDDDDESFTLEQVNVESESDEGDDTEEKDEIGEEEEDEEDSEEENEVEDEENEEESSEDEDDVFEGEDDEGSSLSEDEVDESIPKLQKKSKKIEENGVSPKKKQKTPQKGAKVHDKETKIIPVLKKEVTLQGGVIIEDIKEGDGPPAKNGKFVTVYYEGRLKNSNKVFDATTKGKGFRFRLGVGEVIKGWDIGVAGMKVGGKRKITCPPPMAYGAKGSPPAIPANSTLIFEVELKKIQ